MIFNKTHLEHAVIGLALQVIFGFATGSWVLGAFLAFGFFFGREVAQAEYKWIEHNGGLRSKMPNFKGLDVTKWSTDAVLDVLVPTALMIATYLVKFIFFV